MSQEESNNMNHEKENKTKGRGMQPNREGSGNTQQPRINQVPFYGEDETDFEKNKHLMVVRQEAIEARQSKEDKNK
ncbi:hypothetical protein PP175_15325 [Aneurinibacillus sp. Ricciae_BoGa-3]|uniref:hypothetical protein n=1 Tax=Aneurinibacillus sp. Ricciae_BoGa-3 TaxID=3022697 RepID=UPI0023410A41|nr:hypothetical protein [Aneurinibacillus sp. Ricciae_BoGa-3]WCK52794.1 hypothetical protein PP175_15325 [Aneurinibacillus sp. Ricciae_BoGa-3]